MREMGKRSQFSQSDETLGGNAASRLASVFADVLSLPLDRVHPDLGPDDVERWDSVGHVMLVVALEKEFSIQFEVDEIMEFTSFGAILAAVERRMAAPPHEVREGGRVGT
jgi:acyl carrier protein